MEDGEREGGEGMTETKRKIGGGRAERERWGERVG